MSDAINKEAKEDKINCCFSYFKCLGATNCKYYTKRSKGIGCRYVFNNDCINEKAIKEELKRRL